MAGSGPPTHKNGVTLESGGDHQFDLGHLRRQGALDLVHTLLGEAGYAPPHGWRVRVEKKIRCGPLTRPVAVVGAKPWCCYLKIKPGDNNTAHFCSLLVPAGHRGDAVQARLKVAAPAVNRAWRGTGEPEEDEVRADRHTPDDDTSDDADESAVAADDDAPSELLGWTRDPDKTRLALLAIHEVASDGRYAGIEAFVGALSDKLGWRGLRRKQIGGIFTALVRRGHIQRVKRGSVPVGYALTPEGLRIIGDMIGGDAPAAPPPPPRAPAGPPPDPAKLAAVLAGLAQEYASAYQKLQENRARRAELAAEVARLDAEAAELGRVVANPEVQGLLERLQRLTGPAG